MTKTIPKTKSKVKTNIAFASPPPTTPNNKTLVLTGAFAGCLGILSLLMQRDEVEDGNNSTVSTRTKKIDLETLPEYPIYSFANDLTEKYYSPETNFHERVLITKFQEYLIAQTNKQQCIAELMKHFDDYLDLVPESVIPLYIEGIYVQPFRDIIPKLAKLETLFAGAIHPKDPCVNESLLWSTTGLNTYVFDERFTADKLQIAAALFSRGKHQFTMKNPDLALTFFLLSYIVFPQRAALYNCIYLLTNSKNYEVGNFMIGLYPASKAKSNELKHLKYLNGRLKVLTP